ncbi:MAG: TonB-dependent siderophore receptor [Sphingomonadales bacterium]|nr:TonB-dependent siderophore receptor [Sphingomonadales bacterium]
MTILLQDNGTVSIRSLLTGASALSLLLAAPAMAQDSDTTSGSNANDGTEIVVYGSRTRETTMDIPQTVNVLGPELLEQTGASRLGDVLRFVPGATTNGSELDAFGDRYLMRGFEADRTLNGIRVDRMNHARDAVSIERVEVLKGPASVLYGQLQPGAVINVVTKEPLRDFAFNASAEAGRYDFYRGTVDLSVPLTAEGTVAARVIAAYENADSFIDFWNKDHRFIAPSLLFRPDDDTKILIEGMYSRDKWSAFFNGVPAEGTVLPNPNGPLPRNLHIADPSFDGTMRNTSEVSARLERQLSSAIAVRLAATWNKRVANYQEIFGVLGWVNDATDSQLLRALLDSDGSAETWDFHGDFAFNFNTGGIRHQFTIGAEYGIDKSASIDRVGLVAPLDLYNPVYSLVTAPPVIRALYTNNTRNDVDRLGIFAQERMSVTDNLHLVAGLRYSKVDQRQRFSRGGPVTLTEVTTDSWTSQVGVLFNPVSDVALFASRSTSFVPVLRNNVDGRPLAPETGTQYEAGVKARLAGFNATAAFFHLTRGNVAVSDRDNPAFFLTIGEQVAKGVEISVDGKITPEWSIYAGYGYTDAKTTRDTQAPGQVNREGLRLRGVPKHTFVASTNYAFGAGPLEGLSFGGTVNRVTKRFGDIDESFLLPGYWRVDATLAYKISQNVALRLNVDNVFNDDIYSTGYSLFEVWPSTPRTYRATLSFSL